MRQEKILSIVVPCYNEEENVKPLYEELVQVLQAHLSGYGYEIIFIDNKSTDGTRGKLRELCAVDKRVKCILNAKNFGQFNSPYYGLLQSTGDCSILLAADFQDPIALIVDFVREWEQGCKIVCGVKTSSRENPFVYHLRSCYYKIIKKMSSVEQIEHFTGFGLYDREFIEVLRNLKDPTPFLRGIVAELGFAHKRVPYTQPKRRAGKTHNSFYSLYDAAMLSFTSYTKAGLRVITFSGFILSILSVMVAFVYLVLKLTNWYGFNAGMAPIVIGVFLMGGIQLAAMGFLGEYILTINQRVMNRPLVIEEERINFDAPED